MADITIAKAAPTGLDYPTPEVHIHVVSEVPEFPIDCHEPMAVQGMMGRAHAFYEEQARQIEEALHGSLPGGTYDRLLGLMLARKASHFRVAFGAADA